jgi:hypothetical protein
MEVETPAESPSKMQDGKEFKKMEIENDKN